MSREPFRLVGRVGLEATSKNVSKAISAVCRGPPGPAARTADLSAILNFRDYLEENDAFQQAFCWLLMAWLLMAFLHIFAGFSCFEPILLLIFIDYWLVFALRTPVGCGEHGLEVGVAKPTLNKGKGVTLKLLGLLWCCTLFFLCDAEDLIYKLEKGRGNWTVWVSLLLSNWAKLCILKFAPSECQEFLQTTWNVRDNIFSYPNWSRLHQGGINF